MKSALSCSHGGGRNMTEVAMDAARARGHGAAQ
jgi:hypothetical protein